MTGRGKNLVVLLLEVENIERTEEMDGERIERDEVWIRRLVQRCWFLRLAWTMETRLAWAAAVDDLGMDGLEDGTGVSAAIVVAVEATDGQSHRWSREGVWRRDEVRWRL